MSVARKLSLTVIVLCVLITMGSTAVAAEQIDEPDSWGDPVVTGLDGETPDDVQNVSINYDDNNGLLQFRINYSSDAPANPLENNISQIYIDTGTSVGVDDTTYSGSGATATFYDNLNNLDADERISVGDDSNVVTPWDEDTSQFDGTNSDEADVKRKGDYAVIQVAVEDIKNPDSIGYRFVYIDTRNGIEDEDDYRWAPDGDSNALRFSLEDTGDTVPVGTINATINISNTPAADDTDVDFSLRDEPAGSKSLDDDNNVSKAFSVDSSEFDGNDGDTITATIDGENYTLDQTKTVNVDENKVKNVTFDPYELINVSGDVSGLSGKEGTYTIELENEDDDTIEEKTAAFSEAGADGYEFTDISTAEFTGGGEVVASLESEDNPNLIENDSDTNSIFSTARYNPNDVEVNFTVKGPAQSLNLTTNRSSINERSSERFNLTVDVSTDADGDRIDSFKHVIEFDPSQIKAVNNDTLVSDDGNTTRTDSGDGVFETFVVNDSDGPVVKKDASEVPVYNITFELVDTFDPDQGTGPGSENSVPVDITTVVDTETEVGSSKLVNSTTDDEPVKMLEFTTDAPGTVDVYDDETVIEENEPFVEDVNHLTTGGDMVDAPVKFDIPDGSVTSNEGNISKIVLRNNDTNTIVDTIECDGDAACGGELEHTPSNDTFLDNGSYVSKNRYNITAVPGGEGSNVTVENPRGGADNEGSQKIYKRADVSLNAPGVPDDRGNVTLGGDVLTILELRGQEATGGLPWENIENAQADVNNDGVIDIVDVTIVADEYEP